MPASNHMATAFLGLGGNLGDPVGSMAKALKAFEQHPDCKVVDVSRVYRTPPWGKTDQAWFFNAAAAVKTTLSPQMLLGLALGIEQALHRVRIERWGPRTLDIDILDFDGLAIKSEQLTIPHPRITERAFVLMPLADFAPDFVLDGRTIANWLETADKAGIEVANEDRDWWKA